MNLKTIIYIFCLFLLCIPNFLYKTTNNVSFSHVLLYGLVFSTILYLTYDLVNNNKEFMETKMSFQVNDSNKLLDSLQSIFGFKEQETEIRLNNNMGEGILLQDMNATTNNSPKPFGPIAPIDNVDASILTPKPSEEIINKINSEYENAYINMVNPPSTTYNYKEDGCMANYNDPVPCCTQPGETVSFNRTCTKSKPFCVNYIANDDWGQCISSGGGGANPVVVLGNYNISPWSLSDSWIDQGAKWIWFTPNANIVSSPNSCAIFQYMYYAETPTVIHLNIACGQYCYIVVENTRTRKTSKIKQEPTNGKGVVHNIQLDLNTTIIYFYCYSTGFDNHPAGLIVSAFNEKKDKILFHSDDTWTWFQGPPLLDSVIFDKTLTYQPVVALWNKQNQGFLKMNADGSMDLLPSSNKKLNNGLECIGTIFMFQLQEINNKAGTHSISLYNYGNNQYISMNDSNEMVGIKNMSQSPLYDTEQWIPLKVTSTTCAFYNVKYYPEKNYLGINNKQIVGTKSADLSSQWEIVYLDVIKVGTSREISTVPSYIEHVYNCPLGVQENTNDTFMITLNNNYLYNNSYKRMQIARTDSSFYASWKQNLLLPGINTKYYEKMEPEFVSVLKKGNINIKQFLVYKGIYLACSSKGELCVSNGQQWILVPNASITTYGTTGGIGGNMVMGWMNNKEVLFCVGPLITVPNDTTKFGAIYYRPLKNISDSNSQWTLYSSQTDGSPITSFRYIEYCSENQKLYSIVKGNLNELSHNGNYMTTRVNQSNNIPTDNFTMVSLNYNGTYIVGIDQNSYIYKNGVKLDTNGLGPYEMLANNTELSKLVVVHNIIFALHKNDGKIYYVPLYGGIIKEYNSKLNGNLIDIVGYNNVLYLVDNQNNVVKTQIIFE